MLEPFVFPGVPELYARYEDVELLRDAISGLDAVVVAVGAGTLNDLAKRACGELGRPYAVVGTAASMDGYTAGTSRVGRRPSRRPAPALPGNKSLTRANGMGDSVPRNHRA